MSTAYQQGYIDGFTKLARINPNVGFGKLRADYFKLRNTVDKNEFLTEEAKHLLFDPLRKTLPELKRRNNIK